MVEVEQKTLWEKSFKKTNSALVIVIEYMLN